MEERTLLFCSIGRDSIRGSNSIKQTRTNRQILCFVVGHLTQPESDKCLYVIGYILAIFILGNTLSI